MSIISPINESPSKKDFILLIENIGMEKRSMRRYIYEKFIIDLYSSYYYFFNDVNWDEYDYNDLEPIKKNFNKELRSYKLKQILDKPEN